MRFLVDGLPYYGEDCHFDAYDQCWARGTKECPMIWDKYKVCSEDNPHECMWLKEVNYDYGAD